MLRFFTLLTLLNLASCSGGRDARALVHPDITLAKLANAQTGSSQLFKQYNPDGPVLWNQDWPWKLDFSGIAWDRSNTGTAITPRHVVMAAHYTRKEGQTIVFHDRRGKRYARTIEQVIKLSDKGVSCDIAIGLLDRTLPRSIRCYPLPQPNNAYASRLTDSTAILTEQRRNLYFHQIAGIQNGRIFFKHDPNTPANRKTSLIAGDSGHPSFLLSRGHMVLIETHSSGGPGAGPFYGDPAITSAIKSIIQETDSSYQLKMITLE